MLTKEMIQNSMEMKWCKRDIKLISIGLAVALLVLMIQQFVRDEFPFIVFLFTLLIVSVLFGGVMLYGWISWRLVYLRIEEYAIHEVVLEHLSVSYSRRGYVYFTVPITTKEGNIVYCKTSPIWSDDFGEYKIWEYHHVKVKVAYNEERNDLIVLGKADLEGEYERNYSND